MVDLVYQNTRYIVELFLFFKIFIYCNKTMSFCFRGLKKYYWIRSVAFGSGSDSQVDSGSLE